LTIRNSWAQTIRVHWFVSLLLVAGSSSGQSLEPLAKAFRDKPGPLTRAPLERFLMQHPKDADGALARLVLFHGDTSAGSLDKLRVARALLPELRDYTGWMIASTALAAKDYSTALAESLKVLEMAGSPLEGRAAIVALKAARQLNQFALLDTLAQRHSQAITPAQVLLFRAIAAFHSQKLDQARELWSQLLREWPRTAEATEALQLFAITELRPAERLARAHRLLEQGDAGTARAEYIALQPRLTGAEAELARVRIGVCDYRLRRPTALDTLRQAEAVQGEADAERLFYALLAARRAQAYDAMGAAMQELTAKYPNSPYRLEGLASAASQYWVMGEHTRSLPLYEACALEFPQSPEARTCRWKVALLTYLLNRPEAGQKLLGILREDPAGEHASAALYFLGRLAEAHNDRAAAATYFRQAIASFPNHFYAELSRDRLADAALAAMPPDALTAAALEKFELPKGGLQLSFEPSAATRRRLARAELLARGALYELAEWELRHEARGSEQAHLLALAAAKMANRRGAPDQGIRYVKSIFPAYLSLPINQATLPLWQAAYPMPYKDPLLTYSAMHKVDPYLMAGLVRQESEFSAQAVSRANAHGLTQIMPSTGRELARRLGINRFTPRMLFDPATNLKMGTYYLSSLIQGLDGSLAHALASYNAGRGRVNQWLSWGNYRDAGEFVESIPFAETRGYVQSVMRNAGIYRRLYGKDAAIAPAPVLPSGNGDSRSAPRRRIQ
jgi:soluble lytic murein transglycosylase